MIDFKDKRPVPPMGWGEKLFLASVVVMQAYGLYVTAIFAWNSIKGILN